MKPALALFVAIVVVALDVAIAVAMLRVADD